MSRLKKGGAIAATLVTLVGGFEGLRQSAYKDPVGIPTVCYGETRGVRMGQKYTKTECDAMLVHRLDEFADGVERCIHRPMDDNVYAAFVDLAYNIGTGAFCRSSVARNFNQGNRVEACNSMLKWDKAAGIRLPGLTRRRKAERDLCLKPTAARD